MNRSIWIAVVVLIILGLGAFLVLGRNSNNPGSEPNATTASVDQAAVPTEIANPTASSTESASVGSVKEFTVEGSPFKFVPATINVKKGDKVKITFKNLQGTHNFIIDELSVKTKTVQTGQSEVVEFIADKSGTFEYYCGIGNHRAMGMKGTLVVE